MANKSISFDTRRFLVDTHIEHTETGPKATKNRIQIHCPFCIGSKNFHLGIHVADGHANCWRCGPHSIIKIIHEVLRVSWSEVYKIMDQYSDVSSVRVYKTNRAYSAENVVLPKYIEELKDRHKSYLRNERGFDPELIKSTWDIRSIGPVGEYKHRIFIPIYYKGRIVSFQCRSIVKGDDVVRYLTCPPDKESVFHKSILYGLDSVVSDTVVVVEGVTDVWRMGTGAVATFGIKYMKEQVYQLSKFTDVYIIFDPEREAQRQANKLANELAFMKGCNPYVIDISSTKAEDPGKLPQQEADQIMQDIMLGKFR